MTCLKRNNYFARFISIVLWGIGGILLLWGLMYIMKNQ